MQKRDETDESAIYQQIHAAIAGQGLLPGVRLVEDQLAELFGVNRMRIRSVLRTLAHDKVVTLHQDRGAGGRLPHRARSEEVFAARRLLEVALAPEIVRVADDEALAQLRAHVREEKRCRSRQGSGTRASRFAWFPHLAGADRGQPVVIAFLRELMARSSLITAAYERRGCEHVLAQGALAADSADREA